MTTTKLTYQISHAPIDKDEAINTLLDQFCRWSTKNQIHNFEIDHRSTMVSGLTIEGDMDLYFCTDELRMPEGRTATVKLVEPNRIEMDVNRALEIIQGINQ